MHETFVAGHLPGLDAAAVPRQVLQFRAHGRSLEVSVPALGADGLSALAGRVREQAQRRLRDVPVATVVDWIDTAVQRLLDVRDPLRRQLDDLLPVVTGLDAELQSRTLTGYLHALRGPQLRRFLAADLPNPQVLDGFQASPSGGLVRAFGPALAVHVWAGNTAGLPAWSLVCNLLAKGGLLGKLPSAEPVFGTVFAQSLAQARPDLAQAFALAWWPGGDALAARAAFAQAETVVAYGGNASLDALRAQVPAHVRFLGHGHKLAVALVGREALDQRKGPAAAEAVAWDVLRHEQQGCYSPQMLYLEQGGAMPPAEFAEHLAGALARLSRRHPRRVLGLDAAAGVAAWRAALEFRADLRLLGEPGGDWALAFAETAQPLLPSPGERCLLVCGVADLAQVPPMLAPHAHFLQTVGLACDPQRLPVLAEALGAAGATRIAALGAMAQPEPGWYHDGRFGVSDLIRVVGIDAAAERAADRLAAYAQETRP